MQLKKDTIKAVEERRGNNVMLKTGAWSCKELLVEFVKADSVIDFFFSVASGVKCANESCSCSETALVGVPAQGEVLDRIVW